MTKRARVGTHGQGWLLLGLLAGTIAAAAVPRNPWQTQMT